MVFRLNLIWKKKVQMRFRWLDIGRKQGFLKVQMSKKKVQSEQKMFRRLNMGVQMEFRWAASDLACALPSELPFSGMNSI